MRVSGVSPSKAPDINHALVMHNKLIAQILEMSPKEGTKILTGQHTRGTRVAKALAKRLKMDRRAAELRKLNERSLLRKKKTNFRRRKIQEREDHSTCLPGKRDDHFRCLPKNVLEVQYNTQKVCLCIYHQNMELKLSVLKELNIPLTPDSYIQYKNSNMMLLKRS